VYIVHAGIITACVSLPLHPNQYDGLMAVRVLSCDMMLMQIARSLTRSSGPQWNKCSEQNTITANYKLLTSTNKWRAPLISNPVHGLLTF
jgi:hypothetical protein